MMELKPTKLLLSCLVFAVFLGACSSHIPPNIREPVDSTADIAQVIKNPAVHQSRPVRWAGVVLSIDNEKDQSRITLVAFPADDHGRPIISAESHGRFIAVVDEFLEPLVYREEREMTVFGRFDGVDRGKIGDYEYDFPVVTVDEYYLWPERVKRIYYPQPYYDPYYRSYVYPHYPFYPWPYFKYRYPHHIRR